VLGENHVTNPCGDPSVTSHTGQILSGTVAALKAQLGNDIWHFGGGALSGFLPDAGLAHMVELTVSRQMLASGRLALNFESLAAGASIGHR
jgi:dihydrofolate reductase